VLPDGEDQQLLQEFIGYCLTHDTRHHAALILEGAGGNGKGVVSSVVTSLLGEENVSGVPLNAFGDGQRFRLTETLGKLANIVNEAAQIKGNIEDNFKAYVAGDRMLFERKYGAPFTARPTARWIIATNELPRFSDACEGLWRRLYPIRFGV